MLKRLLFSLWYYRRPPWDTRITPPELIRTIEGPASSAPGRALDLGCGTGTNSLYLAQHGWQVVGVDFAAPAIRQARQRAHKAHLVVDFHVADVSRLESLSPGFDLALDIGCLHGLDNAARHRYKDGLSRLLRPGASYLLYAIESAQGCLGQPLGMLPAEVQQLFEPNLRLVRVEKGTHRGQSPSAWYWLERAALTSE